MHTGSIAPDEGGTSADESSPESSASSGRRLPRAAVGYGAAALALAVMALTTPQFYSAGNLLTIGQTVAVLGLVTLAQTFVLIGGGIDFSVGATAALTFFVITTVARGDDAGVPLALAVAVALVLCVAAVNAFLVVQRRIHPFVATLGTSILVAGVMTAWSQGVFPHAVPPVVRRISASHVGPLSGSLAVLILAAIVINLVLSRTVFGRRLYAVGLNPTAAEYAGVRVPWVATGSYFVSAILAMLAGIVLASYTGFADQRAGEMLHLESVAAAVIGGVGLFGGKGTVYNALGGAFLMTAVLNVGLLQGLPSRAEPAVTGIVLLLGAGIYGLMERRA